MNQSNFIKTIDRTNVTNQTKLVLKEISKIESCFNPKIKKRKINSKTFSKYIFAFDYIDKMLIIFFCNNSWSINYIFYNCYWSSCRNSKSNFHCRIFLSNKNNQKPTENNEKQKEKHDKIIVLGKSKLNKIVTLVSKTLIDMKTSHGEFEHQNYEEYCRKKLK